MAMTDEFEDTGSCLCGAVSFTAKAVSRNVGACHCGMCRKWGGAPAMAVDCGSGVTFDGAENISAFDSSPWAERGFCRKCGTHLFYRLKADDQYVLPAGLFDNDESFVFKQQIFIDTKPAFYSFAEKTDDMTEAEVFARYGSSPE